MRLALDNDEHLVTNVKAGDMLWVRSDTFACECWAYAQTLYEHSLGVGLELRDDHPSMVEAMADTGLPYDQVEINDVISFDQAKFIRRLVGPDERVQVWRERITEKERAARARRRDFTRLTLPELDAGLRSTIRRT